MVLIAIIQIATATACYFIGVLVGRKTAGERCRRSREDPIEIAHVGYDAEQLGREK